MRRSTNVLPVIAFAFALTTLASGCKSDAPAEASAKAAAAPAAAAEGAMCQEHGVLEAICTKCNPKMIPVFQAKGDWCEEHGFPESVCPICNPAAGGKPAAELSSDDAPPDGTKIRLNSDETAGHAGIETVKAVERSGGARLEAVATIAYDAKSRAEINARVAGVVKALLVDTGDTVKKGDRLATIESGVVGEDRSRLRAAEARVKAAQASYDREKALFAKGLAAEKEVAAAEQDLAVAKADRSAASAALGMVGGGGGGGSGYTLTAPIAGTVTQRTATIGHMVEVDAPLFEIVDTRTMRADLDIPETELGIIRPGQDVVIRVEGLGDAEFAGTIDYVAPEVDRSTRTAKARVMLKNPEGLLRANMYGVGLISLGAARATVMVPQEAIQRVGEVQLCFVRLGGAEFETRRVKTGIASEGGIEIVSGIKAGEEVVTKGGFLLKTETLKGSIGAGCCGD